MWGYVLLDKLSNDLWAPGFETHVEAAGGGWLWTSPSSYLLYAPQNTLLHVCVSPAVLWLQGELVKLFRKPESFSITQQTCST